MRALQQGFLGSAILAASCFFTVNANADFVTDFENYIGAPEGFPLVPQFGWYLPAGSVNFNVHTYYTGNPIGIPDNPTGGLFFIGGRGPGSNTFCRAEHDIVFSNTLWELAFDICANFNGAAATDNVGSFSTQPAPNDFIQLCSWFVGSAGSRYQIGFMVYNAAGTQAAAPGLFPSPAWQDLPLRNWYRSSLKVDFGANLVTEVSLTDITNGGPTITVNPVGWYLEGGAGGSTAPETAFRFFAGAGSNPGNIIAIDNPSLRRLPPACPPAGTDDFPNTLGCFLVQAPGNPDFLPAIAHGPTVVQRREPEEGPGGVCTIPTEIVAMTLTGVFDPCRANRPVTANEDPAIASAGSIVSSPNGQFPAHSDFDVHVIVDIQGLPSFPHSAHPGADINSIPPCVEPSDDVYSQGFPSHDHFPCPPDPGCCLLPATMGGCCIEVPRRCCESFQGQFLGPGTRCAECVAGGIEPSEQGLDGPRASALHQAVTSGVTGEVEIGFDLSEAGLVRFEILDVAGRVVNALPSRAWAAGTWQTSWNGKDDGGRRVPTGVYWVRMSVDAREVGKSKFLVIH